MTGQHTTDLVRVREERVSGELVRDGVAVRVVGLLRVLALPAQRTSVGTKMFSRKVRS